MHHVPPSIFKDEFAYLRKQCFAKLAFLFTPRYETVYMSTAFAKMTAMPDNLIETPDRASGGGLSMDVLDEILGSLRLTGGVVIDGEFSGEFCVPAQFGPNHFAPFFEQPETVISYHYVRSGKLVVEVEGMAPVAIAPRNDPHNLASRSGLRPANPSDVSWVTTGGVHRVTLGTGSPKAEIWCGFLGADNGHAHPLLDALPPLLVLDASASEARWLESSLRYLAEQGPSSEIVARLAELFLTQAIRDYVENLPSGSTGWLRGLTDPAVSKALSIIHSRYAEDLDVETLAREAGVSRSVLGERFAELIGEPPMRYCAGWRMGVAADMLREGRQNTANIAYAVGFNSEAAFNRAFKREHGEPPATWRRRVEAEALARSDAPQPLPKQAVRYCSARDGTRLAFSAVGDGPPLVKAANWLNHIEHDWKSPVWRHWLREFTRGHCLVRYDERGNGMSDWDTPELSFEAFVDDLETVVDHIGLDQFDLLGISQGAAVAIAYAVRHPERVRKMVLYGGYAAGWAARGEPEEIARREAMVTLTEAGWGADHPGYRQLFTSLYIPGGTAEQIDWFNDMQKVSASPENAVRMQRVLSRIDVRDLLGKVSVPTLIVHARGDRVVPFAAGKYLADHIPGAVFVPVQGENHILLEGDPGWKTFARVTREFLEDKLDPAREVRADELGARAAERIDSCTSADGTRIAYAVSGEGFPLVKSPNWMTNLGRDRENPVYRHWIDECSRTSRFIRSDMRGFGMSEHEPKRFEFEAMVEDLAAVIDHEQVEQCDLLGVAHGAAIAIAYAARNPERVRKLVLVNSFAAGWRVRADPDEIAWRESLWEMNRRQMAFRRSALGEMFITLYFPSASNELIEWHNEHLAELGPNEILEPMINLASWIDVRGELGKVRAPTLVVHARKDGNAPLAAGRAVAEAIEGARFVELDSANHVLLGDEPAWPAFVRELRAFLAD
jgi:pimeloyl-ACP methyl ester carboxylesterase/AraC-like DNA-binding protein